jgi:hypothetical protein
MIYLYGYLAIGVVVLALVLGEHWLTTRSESKLLDDLLEALDPERVTLSYRILKKWVAPMLGSVAIVLVWPLAAYLKGKDVLDKRRRADSASVEGDIPLGRAFGVERKFEVERSHLQECLTVAQIEARERVTDPLGAVPDLPFGHLHAAWKDFISQSSADDEIWSFTRPWETQWGHKEVRAGYTLMRDGAPVAYMWTMWRDAEDDTESVPGSESA